MSRSLKSLFIGSLYVTLCLSYTDVSARVADTHGDSTARMNRDARASQAYGMGYRGYAPHRGYYAPNQGYAPGYYAPGMGYQTYYEGYDSSYPQMPYDQQMGGNVRYYRQMDTTGGHDAQMDPTNVSYQQISYDQQPHEQQMEGNVRYDLQMDTSAHDQHMTNQNVDHSKECSKYN